MSRSYTSSPRLITRTALLVFSLTVAILGHQTLAKTTELYYFRGDGCPYCALQEVFLDELETTYPELQIHAFEVWYDAENRQLMRDMAEAYGVEARAVPMTFIGERVWTGFSSDYAREMQSVLETCLQTSCDSPAARLEQADPSWVPSSEGSRQLTLPLVGSVDLALQPLILSTALIAFVDGFNPCSLWVLSVLLALVVHTGSRKRVFVVGITFLLVTAAIYGLFMVGIFNVLSYVGYLGWVQGVVALFALTFALVNIKDYFWYKRGISFTISDKHKPGIYQRMRGVMNQRSTLPAIGTTALMATGIALVELPCTAGFPVIWSNLIAERSRGLVGFALLLALYLLIYLLIELVIFSVVLVTLKTQRFEERHGRALKLIGGMIMLALATVLIVNPAWMDDVASSLLVFGVALAVSLLVMIAHQAFFPQLGAQQLSRAARRRLKPSKRDI